MFNLVASGHLTKDATAQLVQGQNGAMYSIKFDLAVNKRSGDNNYTTYIPCVYWCKTDKIVQYLKKGKGVVVSINWYRNEKEQNGDRYFQSFRVAELDFQSAGSSQDSSPKTTGFGEAKQPNQTPQHNYRFDNVNGNSEPVEDDLPF